MGAKSYDYQPKYRLTNHKTGQSFEARGWQPVLVAAGLGKKTTKQQINRSLKWSFQEIEPPIAWDQRAYRSELYQKSKYRYAGYEHTKLGKDPLYEKRKQLRRKKWLNLDGSAFTAEQHDELLKRPCAICGECNKRKAVDHHHDSGVVRDCLCFTCNVALGNFKDSADLLFKAAAYIRLHENLRNENKSK